MGGGAWASSTYDAVTSSKISSGTSFGYDRAAKASGVYAAHKDLDPKWLNAAGLNIRESRDSDEHPLSTPIIVGFDSTGSMGSVPRTVQQKLATLFKLLVDKNYCTDPQVAIATYGDASPSLYRPGMTDKVPLQISQFESDNRIDDNLDKLFLEGGGGANDGETSQLLLYYAAHHTAIDSFEKRGKKGYLFLIADEKQVPIGAGEVTAIIGSAAGGEVRDTTFEGIAAAVTEKWNVRVLLINNSTALYQRSEEFYSNLFGPDALTIVQDPEAIAETIAALIGFEEGRDLATITSDLTAAAGKEVALRVGESLAKREGGTKVALR